MIYSKYYKSLLQQLLYIYNNIALIPCDTQEKGYFSHATKPCGRTHCGCGRCIQTSYELLDSKRIPFNDFRSPTHFAQYCKENPNAKKDDLSKNGYSSNEAFQYNAKSLDNNNIVQKLAVDSHHSTLNQAKYLDKCVKADYVWVCAIFDTFVLSYNITKCSLIVLFVYITTPLIFNRQKRNNVNYALQYAIYQKNVIHPNK